MCVCEDRGEIKRDKTEQDCCSPHTLGSHISKDTCLLSVGHRCGATSCHVAVEGHLQSVAVGRVIEETTEEPSTRTGLHHVPVEGCVGLEKQQKKQLYIETWAREDTLVGGFGFESFCQHTSALLKCALQSLEYFPI